MQLQGKTLFVTGSTRGIGLAIAKRAALDGANVVVIGKTDEPHPKLPGTVHTAAEEIRSVGGQAIACVADIRFQDQLQAAIDAAVREFGGIDIVVNNASAIFLAGTAETPMKRFDLMHAVNVRATYMTTQLCLPQLKKADNPHVLNISPPLNLDSKWFAGHVAYTMAKYGMSMCVLGMAEEFRSAGIAVNALWPQTAIATAAVQNLLGGDEAMRCCRKPEIMADAAYEVLIQKSSDCTGNFFIDEDLILGSGGNLDDYTITPGAQLLPDFFVEPKA